MQTRNRSYPLDAGIDEILGEYYLEQKDYHKALDYLNKALFKYEHSYELGHPSIGLVHFYIGKICREMGDKEKAINHLTIAKEMQSSSLNSNHPEYLATLDEIAHINNAD